MRVTETGIFEGAKRSTAAASESFTRASERAATGLALRHAWDDPRAGIVVREQYERATASGIAQAAERRSRELSTVDGALDAVVSQLTSTLELAIQLANDTYNAQDRANAVPAVTNNLAGIVAALNVDVAGRFVFGGTSDTSPPFGTDGTYVGDDGVIQQELAPGVLQTVTVRADVAIAGAGGGVDVPAAMRAFADALQTNDVAGIRQSIAALQSGISQVALARSQVGSMQLGLDVAATAQRGEADASLERASAITDVDFVEAATELSRAQRGFEAALSVAAKSFTLSLLDKL